MGGLRLFTTQKIPIFSSEEERIGSRYSCGQSKASNLISWQHEFLWTTWLWIRTQTPRKRPKNMFSGNSHEVLVWPNLKILLSLSVLRWVETRVNHRGHLGYGNSDRPTDWRIRYFQIHNIAKQRGTRRQISATVGYSTNRRFYNVAFIPPARSWNVSLKVNDGSVNIYTTFQYNFFLLFEEG